ncbi:helix-loop-helix DNA-binding domain-containing protein [Choanephora cucurbitarum]|nr:helix-loop-helix DNA-binding domain-containing protein [Choanephora cucurbitarum]
MYSPPQQDYGLDTDHFSQQQMGTPHTTVGAMPVVRNNRLFNPNYHHQRQNSFGTVASAITMSPPNNNHPHRNSMGFHDNNNSQNWFGTSMDSNGSSFGQSPIFTNMPRELVVSPSTSSSHLDTLTVASNHEEDEGQQKNLQEMFEKRRRRRESHNAVERRRRDNINERIHELCTLLPERLLDTAPTSSNVMSISSGQVGANGRAINKGTILKLSVDHIKELREEVYRYQERIKELERMVEAAKHGELIQEAKPHFEDNTQKHHRMGSIQFRQQFNDLQIGTNE